MKPFLYLLKRNFINYIKSIRHKPSKAVPLVFVIAVIILMSCAVIFGDEKTESFNDPKYFIGVATAIIFQLFLFILYSGVTRKNFRYSMSDVNLIFTSPLKPQNVLLYGFLKEISSIFAMSIFLIFQLPNLAFKFSFVTGGIVYLLLIIIAFFIVLSSLSLLIYGFFSKYYKYKELAIKIVKYSSIVVTLALAVYIYTGSNGDYYDFAMDFFNKDWWSYIPVMGWGRALLSQCLTGFNISSLIYGGLLILSCIGSITLLYKFNLDFYEDALPSAEQNEVAQSYKNSGFDSKQLSKMQNSRKPFARRKVTLAYSAKFAKAIFFRHMLEYKKTGFYFINMLSVIYLVASVVVGLYFDIPFFALLLFSIYMMVLSTYAGKWSMDFNGHFIFLIPASSAAKLFYSTLSTILKVTVDSLLLFIPAGILMGVSPLEIILTILAYISFGALSTYGAVLNYKLFDRVSNQLMKGIFMMITLIVYILPGIVIGVLFSFVFEIFAPYSLHISFLVYNTLASLVIVQAAKGIYDSIDT